MRLSIEPIGPRFRESLTEHLAPFGLHAAIVEWKYFQRPWVDALTGLVWLKEGKVRGAIGLVPFHVAQSENRVRASWTCDWAVHSPQSNPGVGVVLLQRAKALAGPLFSLGGNELNRQLMSRIATAAYRDAAVELYLPLRVGGGRIFRGVSRRAGGFLRPLERLSVRRTRGRTHAKVVAGVSPLLAGALEFCHACHAKPLYTVDYLKWQLDRCPGVHAASVFVPSASMSMGAVCWSRDAAPADWRFALWGPDDDNDAMAQVVDALLDHAAARGAQRVSVLASRLDTERLALLEQRGFVSDGSRRPLYVTGDVAGSAPELAGLSFLDTDLAYRI
jgi:hypothetical protein